MRSPRLPIALVLASLALLFSDSARAERSDIVPEVGFNYGENESGRSAGMGSAMRALGNGVTGLYANPANIALTRVYHLQALAQIWPEARRQTYGASAVDSVTGRLAGAIGGHYGVLDPDGVDRKWTDLRVAVAFPLSDRFYAGLTGKYLKLRENGFPRPGFGLPNSPASGGLAQDAIIDSFTFDAGLTIKPTESLFIGLVGSNLTDPGNGFRPLMLGGGVGYGTNDVTVEGDLAADFTTFTNPDGSSRTNVRAMLGFGYIDSQFSVDLAVRRSISSEEPFGPVTSVVIDLQYFLESTGITRSPGERE